MKRKFIILIPAILLFLFGQRLTSQAIIELENSIKIVDNQAAPEDGMLRWSGTDFEGYMNDDWISLTQINTASSKVLNISGSAFLPENLDAGTGFYNLDDSGRSGSFPLNYPIQLDVGIHIDSIYVFINPRGGNVELEFIEREITTGNENTIVSTTSNGIFILYSENLLANIDLQLAKTYFIRYKLIQQGVAPPVVEAATIFYTE